MAETTIRGSLASRWAELSEAAREWALRTGRARLADVEIELAGAEDWRDAWDDDEGGSWPTYTLAVRVDGAEVGTVTGCHYCGPWAGDGAYNGTPSFRADSAWGHEPGIGGEPDGWLALPRFGADGAALVYDEGAVNSAIADAAAEADHGDEPDMGSLEPSPRDDVAETLYVLRDWQVVEVEVRRCRRFGLGGDREGREYLLTGYYLVDGEDAGEVCASAREAVEAAGLTGDDGGRYDSEEAARVALAGLVDARLDELDDLPGMGRGRDVGRPYAVVHAGRARARRIVGTLYVAPEGRDDDVYHLGDEQTAAVCRHGWYAVLDDVAEAFGRREALAACRSWQEDMDAVIAERDPWVSERDSLAAGNCHPLTARFAEELREEARARVCAARGLAPDTPSGVLADAAEECGLPDAARLLRGEARASAVLARRDDAYTRRACRMAAQRLLESE